MLFTTNLPYAARETHTLLTLPARVLRVSSGAGLDADQCTREPAALEQAFSPDPRAERGPGQGRGHIPPSFHSCVHWMHFNFQPELFLRTPSSPCGGNCPHGQCGALLVHGLLQP